MNADVQAIILVVDKDVSLTITGMGDVIEPPDGIIGPLAFLLPLLLSMCCV